MIAVTMRGETGVGSEHNNGMMGRLRVFFRRRGLQDGCSLFEIRRSGAGDNSDTLHLPRPFSALAEQGRKTPMYREQNPLLAMP